MAGIKAAFAIAAKVAVVGGTKALFLAKAAAVKIGMAKALIAAKAAIIAKLASMKAALVALGAKIAATKWFTFGKAWLLAKYKIAQGLIAKVTAAKLALTTKVKALAVSFFGAGTVAKAEEIWTATKGVREAFAAVMAVGKWKTRIEELITWITQGNKKCGTAAGQEKCRAATVNAHAGQIKNWTSVAGQPSGKWVQKKVCKNVRVFHWFRWKTEQKCHYEKQWVTSEY